MKIFPFLPLFYTFILFSILFFLLCYNIFLNIFLVIPFAPRKYLCDLFEGRFISVLFSRYAISLFSDFGDLPLPEYPALGYEDPAGILVSKRRLNNKASFIDIEDIG